MLDLSDTTEWIEIAPLNHGRYKFSMVAAGNLLYVVGGQSAFVDRKDIEVREGGV